MATPVLTILEEDKHAWFAGRTRAILKYLDAEVGDERRRVARAGCWTWAAAPATWRTTWRTMARSIGIEYNPRPIPLRSSAA
jgi:hypothetical protein